MFTAAYGPITAISAEGQARFRSRARTTAGLLRDVTKSRWEPGVCSVRGDAAGESCRFSLDSLTLTSENRATDKGWSPLYNDGRRVGIRTTGTRTVPVPFALGR